MLSHRWSSFLIFLVFVFDLKYSASSLLNLPFTTHTKNEDGSRSSVLKVPFALGHIGLQVNYDKKADVSANQNNIQPANTNPEECEPSTESAVKDSQSNNGNSESSGFLLIPQLPNGFNFKVHLGHAGLALPHQRTYNCHQHHYPGSEPYPRPTYDYYPQQPYPPFYYPQHPPPQQPLYPTQEPKPQPPSYYPTQEPKPQYPPSYYPTQEPSPQPPTYYPTPESKPQPPTYYPTPESKPPTYYPTPESKPPTYYPTPESKPPQSYYPTQEPKPQPPNYYPGQEYYPSPEQPSPQPPSYYPGQEVKPQPTYPTYPTYPTNPTNPTNPTYPQKLDPWQPNPNESPSPSVPGNSVPSPDVTETPDTPSESPDSVPTISIGSTPGSVDSGSGTAGNQIPDNENENPTDPWGPSKNEGGDANATDKTPNEESGEGSLDIRLGNNSPGRKPSRNRVQ